MKYGIALNFISFLTVYFWWQGYVETNSTAYCWYYFSNCETLRNFIAHNHQYFCGAIACTAIFSIFGFASRRTKVAYWLLLLGLALKFLMFSQDYRLMGNYHFMHFLVVLFYLFVPNKIKSIYFLIPLFYIAAGFLKINPEWLSGSAMLKEIFFPKALQYWAFLFVIPLELLMAPLIYVVPFKSKAWWLIISSFLIFHLISWQVVGYFYPITMFLILSFYFLITAPPQKFTKPIAPALLLILFALQIFRVFAYPNSNIDGIGRSFSLNMLDGKPSCLNQVIIRSGTNTILTNYVPETNAPRIKCDPLIYAAYLNELCHKLAPQTEVDFSLQTRLQSETHFHDVLNIQNVCAKKFSVNMLGRVSW